MVDEDRRSMLMRQALLELEVTYDAVGAFSVTVDAHKAVRDVTQVFYEEDRQVLLTEVEKGLELRPESPRRPPRHRRKMMCTRHWLIPHRLRGL